MMEKSLGLPGEFVSEFISQVCREGVQGFELTQQFHANRKLNLQFA